MDLDYYAARPDEELPLDLVEALGLDGTGRDGSDRFPYTWANLTTAERARLRDMPEQPDQPDQEDDDVTDTVSEHCEIAVPVPDEVMTGKRINHRRPEELLLRGDKQKIGTMLIAALAELTGDEVIAGLSLAELIRALHTLGELDTAGYLDQAQRDDLLTSWQVDVCTKVADLRNKRFVGCGESGSTDHDEQEWPGNAK